MERKSVKRRSQESVDDFRRTAELEEDVENWDIDDIARMNEQQKKELSEDFVRQSVLELAAWGDKNYSPEVKKRRKSILGVLKKRQKSNSGLNKGDASSDIPKKSPTLNSKGYSTPITNMCSTTEQQFSPMDEDPLSPKTAAKHYRKWKSRGSFDVEKAANGSPGSTNRRQSLRLLAKKSPG
ncbi:uncharacterized protein [Oscarella lobularis]|uniref:uncharacterized protein n=1 Tax=Oscarella lobularis TaxID=121494 RepID=UPI00331344FE